MLEQRRLRLLRELHERGTVAAVAEALQFTPSAVSQQLAMLEREAGVRLLERAGRGVRLTDAALVLVGHAEVLLERVAIAEADLAAAPGLRCELLELEPEEALPTLALGDIDLVLGDEWQHQPRTLPPGVERHELMSDRVRIVLPARHPAARRHPEALPLAELAGEPWTTGHAGLGWDEMTRRTCQELGGFDPDVRHRTNDAAISLAIVAHGMAVAMLPDLALPPRRPGIQLRDIADDPIDRAIFAATRATDAARPSTQALLAAVREKVPASARRS